MSAREDAAAMRDAAREVLHELLPELLAQLRGANGNGHGHATSAPPPPGPAPSRQPSAPAPGAPDTVPAVPAPPVAAVLRPSSWSAPAAPGEVIGDGERGPEPTAPGAERVVLDTDADLQRFAAEIARRAQDPRALQALRSGEMRFTLGRGPASSANPAGPSRRVEKGAVTERLVREAAGAGARLVLGRRAVLTPLARDQARALGVVIEREAK